MKTFTNLLLFLHVFIGASSQPVRTHQLADNTDPVTEKIFETWERYFTDVVNNVTPGNYGIGEDLIMYLQGRSGAFYRIGAHKSFSIEELGGDNYVINTMVELELPGGKSLLPYIYKVTARVEDGEVVLDNYFNYSALSLEKYSNELIDFYYPCSFYFDTDRADECISFVDGFCRDYGTGIKGKIRYIAANTLDECNHILGFSHSIMRSSDPAAGYYIHPRTVVSCRVDHFHELVHVVMYGQFPRASALLHEGMATYYGGGGGMDYSGNLEKLRGYIASLTLPPDDISAHRIIVDGLTPYNVIGAILIEKALMEGGPDRVLEMMRFSDRIPDEYALLERFFGVGRGMLESFVLEFLATHHGL